MNHVKFAVAFSLIAGLLASSNAVVSADELPIEVHGRVERCSNEGATLSLTLKNLAARTIEINKGDLPWGLTSSLFLLVVTKAADPELLKPIHYFDDPRVGSISLKPASVATGEIDLQRRFPDLRTKLKTSDLLVVWSYEAELANNTFTSKVSGSVLIERAQCSL